MNLLKVNTFNSMRICAAGRLVNAFAIELAVLFFLLVGECSWLCVATVYVWLFIVFLRTIKEKTTSLFLIIIHTVQV